MAAGLGFKTFTTGEVLTAADTNGYLMQGINVFASTAARDAAITSPQEGQFAFTKDTNGLWYYDGAAWVASGATGDIEGVTAGVGITGGGTSGTVTITNDMATTITASGDIVVGTGSGTYDNLPIGTTGQLLTADTTVSPYKVKWATPAAASSGMTLITNTTLTATATDFTFSSIPSTYTHLKLVLNGRTNESGANVSNIKLQLNGDTGSNYRTTYGGSYAGSMSVTTAGADTSFDLRYINGVVQTTYGMGVSEIILPDYKGTVLRKGIQWITTCYADSGSIFTGNGSWQNTSAITSVKILAAAGSFIVGSSVSLYGWS